MMPTTTISLTEIRKATTACRSELRLGLEYLGVGDTTKAFAAFERAQHYAYQAKDMTANGGRFEDEPQ